MKRKEREERKLNVIIKGIKLDRRNKNLERKIEKFPKDSIETDAEIETARVINEGKMIQVKFIR